VTRPARGLPQLERCWPSVELPGYRDHPAGATYSPFRFDDLPPIERELDDGLAWLLSEPKVAESIDELWPGDPRPARPATLDGLADLVGDVASLPPSFVALVTSPEPRTRIRSATRCYLDLGDRFLPVVGGGRLIHFLSDQQWALHWLMYVDSSGSEAVVVTEDPIGFVESLGDSDRAFDPSASTACVCAESFSEFLYRFWIENEIWFRFADADVERRPPTDEQVAYLAHYRS
jgi:hypothetical protein